MMPMEDCLLNQGNFSTLQLKKDVRYEIVVFSICVARRADQPQGILKGPEKARYIILVLLEGCLSDFVFD
jgi:hypothetical protein